MTNGRTEAQSHHPECSQLKTPVNVWIGIHDHEGACHHKLT